MAIPPNSKRFISTTAIGLIVSCLALALHQTEWIDAVEMKSVDHRFRQYADPAQARADIVLLAADEASMKAIGQWPWHRDLHGFTVDFLKAAGAKAIVYDVAFLEPDNCDPEFDGVFSRSIKAAGNVVLATLFVDDPELPAPEFLGKATLSVQRRSDATPLGTFVHTGLKIPIPSLAQSAIGLGFVNLTPDRDGIVRRVPLFGQAGHVEAPVLALAVAKMLAGIDDLTLDSTELRLGNTMVPLTSDGRLLINWHGTLANNAYKSFRLGAVVQSANEMKQGRPPFIDPSVFKDKIVFVATTAAGTYEVRPTPLSSASPGVLIHMAMLDDLLQGRFMKAPPWYLPTLTIIALCLTSAWSLTFFRSIAVKIGTVAGIAVAYYGIVVFAFTQSQWWIELVLPLGAQGVTFATVTTVEYFTEGRKRRQLRAAFDKYMSSEVVDEIMRHPDTIALGGERRDITVLFTDVAGFTGISEQLTPEELVQLLNRYLSAMTTTIRAQRGNVNKYLGDGIMAMFGAPLKESNHATLACLAALAMQTQLEQLRDVWIAEGYPRVTARIGISTGPLVVGNVGSNERLEYTVIGDTVNLASRLEGANKFYQTGILIGPKTYELAKADIEARPIDLLRVKGRREPVIAYELLGQAGQINPLRQELLRIYKEGFAAYRTGRFTRAKDCFEQVLNQDPNDASAAIHRDRAIKYLADPPPLDWDGVFELKSK
ncbi:MAG: CHASE2 domain-containing protein [Nitrospira sp.]|nr:CHASE2 domain-containing protein [Nitrospira sp.]